MASRIAASEGPGSATVRNGRHPGGDRLKAGIKDEPGEFRWIDKELIHVDPTYQRAETESKVQSIARRWSWVACGVILVALRCGIYYAFDGGHRTLAARRRKDITELPCLVFHSTGVESEAQGFLDVNTQRRPVLSIEKFRALVTVGDPDAVAVRDMIEQAGYTISGSGGKGRSVRCVGRMMRCHQGDRAALLRVWPLVLEACDGGPIHDRVVGSLYWIESRLTGSEFSLARQPWRDRVVRLGSAGIVEAATKASAFYGRGGEKIWGEGVVEALNRGVRNRLQINQPIDQPEG